MKLLEIINVDRSTTLQVFYIHHTQEKHLEYNGTVHQLFIYFKKKCDSFRREVLYNIPTEFGTHTKIVRLIKVCLNETYSKVCTEKICLMHLLFSMT
jgi:hypothetical protein